MIFKSPHAPVTIPEVSITDYVLRRAEELGESPRSLMGERAEPTPTANCPNSLSG